MLIITAPRLLGTIPNRGSLENTNQRIVEVHHSALLHVYQWSRLFQIHVLLIQLSISHHQSCTYSIVRGSRDVGDKRVACLGCVELLNLLVAVIYRQTPAELWMDTQRLR
jgi:hypothetical protein